MKPWADVVGNPEFKALPFSDRQDARVAYFYDAVTPNVHENEWGAAWAESTRNALAILIAS